MRKKLVKIACVVPEIPSWTDRRTDRDTDHNFSAVQRASTHKIEHILLNTVKYGK